MYYVFKLLVTTLFILYGTTAAFADTREDIDLLTNGTTFEIRKKAYTEEKQFEGQLKQQRNEIMQTLNSIKGNAEGAIYKCDRAFYESLKSESRRFQHQKTSEIGSQIKFHRKEISRLKPQTAKLEENYNRYFKQVDELSLVERLTTKKRKELLELAASALIKWEKSFQQLKIAEFKYKKLNPFWFDIVGYYNFPEYPKNCVTGTYSHSNNKTKPKPLDIKCLAVIDEEGQPRLCIVSKKIVYAPKDKHIADATWTLVRMDGELPKEGIEIPMHALLSYANGSPVGRGKITYGGSKTEKGGLLIFHWDVSPDYRVVVKPANASGSGATLSIEPQ